MIYRASWVLMASAVASICASVRAGVVAGSKMNAIAKSTTARMAIARNTRTALRLKSKNASTASRTRHMAAQYNGYEVTI